MQDHRGIVVTFLYTSHILPMASYAGNLRLCLNSSNFIFLVRAIHILPTMGRVLLSILIVHTYYLSLILLLILSLLPSSSWFCKG